MQAKRHVAYYMGLGYLVVGARVLLGINAIGLRTASASMDSSFTNTPSFVDRFCTVPSYWMAPFLYLDSRLAPIVLCSVTASTRRRIRHRIDVCLNLVIVVVSVLLLLGFRDAYLRVVPRSPPQPSNGVPCDPMDTTECFLPFPSFHMLREDPSTATGFRVHFHGEVLPPLKSGKVMDPAFLNQLDGFSTMGPILFYLDGLKEAQLAGVEQLKGPDNIAESTTSESATFLIDVANAKLLPHSAEIDFLDSEHPLVMIFPAKPLRHNDHYAVAVVNAQNRHGKRLPQSRALHQLLHSTTTASSPADPTRRDRYTNTVIPALEQAAPWFHAAADDLQLLFDFHTVSAVSQLGSVRTVRDRTLNHINVINWDWTEHVRTVAVTDFESCGLGGDIARTVHAELDVPWFLDTVGSGSRYSVLSDAVLHGKRQPPIGTARFVLHVPCSLKFAALHGIDFDLSKPLRAVMDYGHGLFGNRDEANDAYIGSIANNEGYLIMAIDWRGMSAYDLLNVIKTLISTPEQAQALRDNIIQGYASKYALQSFARTTLLSMDWLRFKVPNQEVPTYKAIPTLDQKNPSFVFYGVSQGGILGAGYTTLSGKTGLIDRAVLTAAGTPFAFIMTRSLDFKKYDQLLLLNYYTNRHVRVAIALVQMAWDSVEAAGTLAPPLSEPYPPTLLQAGLGDAIVSTFATEFLARAFNASTVPRSPHDVFGLDKMPAADKVKDAPLVSLTELLYDKEYASLPHENKFAKGNSIHYCIRSDKALVAQLIEFVNLGRVVDPCNSNDVCHRSEVTCYNHYD